MSEQFNELGEQTKLINMAAKYTSGDLAKAKEMVAGHFDDIIVVKIKFFSDANSVSGILFAFFNVEEDYISYTEVIRGSSDGIFRSVRIFDSWKTLYKDAAKFKANDNSDDNTEFNEFIIDKFIEVDLFQAVEDGDLDKLTKSVTTILGDYFVGGAKCQLELEKTNSLAMELEGIEFNDLIPDNEEEESQSEDQVITEAEVDPRTAAIEAEATHIVSGDLIVAPVKGKYLNDIAIGEKLMVILDTKNPVSAKLINILKARDKEGNLLPIKGRLTAKIPLEKGGYTLYALVAKSVLAKIIEEENIKVRMEDSNTSEKDSKDSGTLFIIIFLVALILIIGTIIFAVLA